MTSPPGSARRGAELFARETFARSSSVLNPQLWLAVWREAPIDADVVQEPDRQLAWRRCRPADARPEDRHGGGRGSHRPDRRPARLDRPPDRSPRSRSQPPEPTAARARRRMDRSGAGSRAAHRPRIAGQRARHFRRFRSERPRLDRRRAGRRARADRCQCARSRHARAGSRAMAPRCDERPLSRDFLSPRHDHSRDLGRRAADRACGRRRRLAQHRGCRTGGGRRLSLRSLWRKRFITSRACRDSRARGRAQGDAWTPLRTLGWAFAFVILAAALAGYIAFATFLINQAIYLTVLGSALYLADMHRSGWNRSAAEARGAGWSHGSSRWSACAATCSPRSSSSFKGSRGSPRWSSRSRPFSSRGACSRRTCSARCARPISASRSAASPCRCHR